MAADRNRRTPSRAAAGARRPARTTRPATPARPAKRTAGGSSRPQVRPASAGGGRVPATRRRPTSLRRMVTLGLLLVVLAVLLIPTLRGYLHQRSQIETLNDQVTKQQQTVNALQKQRDRWNDPTYVSQQARERLGFAKPGERAYIVVDKTGKKQQVEPVTGIRNDKAAAGRPWYGQVWGSVVSAGKMPEVGSKTK